MILQVAATMLDEMASDSHSVTLVIADGKPEPSRLVKSSGADLTKPLKRLAIAAACDGEEDGSASTSDLLAIRLTDLSHQLRGCDLVVVSGRENRDFLAGDPSDAVHSRAANVLGFFQRAKRLSWINLNDPSARRYIGVPIKDVRQPEKSHVDS